MILLAVLHLDIIILYLNICLYCCITGVDDILTVLHLDIIILYLNICLYCYLTRLYETIGCTPPKYYHFIFKYLSVLLSHKTR